MNSLATMFSSFALIPVVVLDNVSDAVPLAEALLEGGINSIEITLRTDAGLNAITEVARRVPDILCGAGTIITVEQMRQVHDAGAVFQVSPGLSDSLGLYAKQQGINWLPGVANASNIISAIEYDVQRVKFFPASLSGGIPMLKQFAAVFPKMQFCPTGGIDEKNLHEYAALASVFAIGGSWLTPKELIAAKDWKGVSLIAKQSMALIHDKAS